MLKSDIFKANDIRGIVVGPDLQWDLAGAWDLGNAYVRLLELAGKEFVLGRDMRQLGVELAKAFIDGARAAGASVVDIGLASTDQLWFASGKLAMPGVQFTASHNPAEYNGIKFCLPNAGPVPAGFTTELAKLANQTKPVQSSSVGNYRSIDLLADYVSYLNSLVQVPQRRRLRVVVDAGNGMAGHTVGAVLASANIELIGLYLDLDGSFPNHPANPLVPENLVDAQQKVLETGADLGLVFDGDADRCFIIDGDGAVVDPSIITALIAEAELRREPGATIVINTITSATVKAVVEASGGQVVVSNVGHTYVKAKMANYGAIFGGEHSAHYYFREFWGADTGILAALHVMAMLANTDTSLRELVMRYDYYSRSGEINSVVENIAPVLDGVEQIFGPGNQTDRNDGLTIRHYENNELVWWLNLRPSNTEALLRLNVEAVDQNTMQQIRDQVLAIIKENK